MRRREFLIGVGSAVMASATANAQQQQSAVPVIGFLNGASPATFANYVAAFRHGLQETGYVEGQNLAIEFRWAEGHEDKLAALAADLVGRRVAVIAATGGPVSAPAAKAATSTTPIVFVSGGDPVKRGLVASLGHPGGNATGYNLIAAELDGKRVGLLHDVVLAVRHPAVLLNPKNPNFVAQKEDVKAAAQTLGLQLTMLEAASPNELDAALAKPRFGEAGALLVGADLFFNSRRGLIVELVAGLSVPAIYEWREFVDAGGLMSYGPSLADGYRQVGAYVGRILKGEKPADLPVIQPTRFELVINQKTAKALGLVFPQLLLSQADDVIE